MTDKEFVHNFWANVKATLKRKNIERKALCIDIGIKEKTLSAMICRDTPPDICLLTRIRNVLDTECTELLYSLKDTKRQICLTNKERELIECLRKIHWNEGLMINTIIAVLTQVYNLPEATKKKRHSSSLKKIDLAAKSTPKTKKEKKDVTSKQESKEKAQGQTFFDFGDFEDSQ